MKAVSLSIVLVVLAGSTGVAFAQEPAAKPEQKPKAAARGIHHMPEVVIPGKRQRPLASVAINRVPLESTLARLRQPLVDRIAASAERAPF
jgi:hypothetical protein